MNGSGPGHHRTRRILLIALALSLLVHLIVALLARPVVGSRETDAEVVSIEHRSSVSTMATPHPPPPRPRVTPPPPVVHPLPSSRPLPKATHATQAAGNGGTQKHSAVPTPAPPSTPAPAPSATTVAQSCVHADLPASVTTEPDQPDIPVAAREQGTAGTSVVRVALDPSGAVTAAAVSQSSGNAALDAIAVTMARAAGYAPATRDCKPVAGDYAFSVKFVAW
jgi:TonB family protein